MFLAHRTAGKNRNPGERFEFSGREQIAGILSQRSVEDIPMRALIMLVLRQKQDCPMKAGVPERRVRKDE